MTTHEKGVRSFTVYTASFDSPTNEDIGPFEVITIGLYTPDGWSGEFEILWDHKTWDDPSLEEPNAESVPRLCAFEEGWSALVHCQDLLEGLAAMNGTTPSRERIIELLQRLNFEDRTNRPG